MKGKSDNWADIPDKPSDPVKAAKWLEENYYAIEAADLADGAGEKMSPEERDRWKQMVGDLLPPDKKG